MPQVDSDRQQQQMEAASARLMGSMAEQGDAPFGGEVALASRIYWWHDKYRPRKPKYFNRVHTGYEWNKYNQTHYDHDNPPPKVGRWDRQWRLAVVMNGGWAHVERGSNCACVANTDRIRSCLPW